MNKQIIKENMEKRNEFVNSQPIVNVKVSDIFLKEKIHLKANCNFKRQIEKLRSKNVIILDNPIIIRQELDNNYSLVSGYRGYYIARELNHEFIPAIVTNESKKDFTKKLELKNPKLIDGADEFMKIKDIIIPKPFLNKNVKREKINSILDYYNIHKELDKPVVIKDKRLLIDGYARYVAAKILKLDKVAVKYEKPDTIITTIGNPECTWKDTAKLYKHLLKN